MITSAMIKELRATTGAGMLDCKKALEKTEGNIENAIEILRERFISCFKEIRKNCSRGYCFILYSSRR